MAALTTTQIAGLNSATVSGLSATALSYLSSSQVSTLLADEGSALTPRQIIDFSASQLASANLVGTAGGLQFNLEWASSMSEGSAQMKNAAISAAAEMSALFTNKVVVNIQVGLNTVDGQAIKSDSAANISRRMTTLAKLACRRWRKSTRVFDEEGGDPEAGKPSSAFSNPADVAVDS